MGHEIRTLSLGIRRIHEEITEVGTEAEFKAFRERWCAPWDRTLTKLNDNPILKAWVIRRWEELKPRILVQRELAIQAWKCAAEWEGDLRLLSGLD
jgi:hypothetical protein